MQHLGLDLNYPRIIYKYSQLALWEPMETHAFNPSLSKSAVILFSEHLTYLCTGQHIPVIEDSSTCLGNIVVYRHYL